MKNTYLYVLICLTCLALLFTSCKMFDNKPPNIYLSGSADTTILLREKYIDPGYYAEDNYSDTEDILLEDNLTEILEVNDDGYVTRHQAYEVTYTATDEEGNSSSVVRTIRVQNNATPYSGSYNVHRTFSVYWGDTTYATTVSVDTRVAGRLKVNKLYNHWDPVYGSQIYFQINADLWASDLTSVPHYDNASNNSGMGYMGNDGESSIPWYRNMSYENAVATRRFEYIKIESQTINDDFGNASFLIQGSAIGGVPLSTIEYIGTEIYKITLKYNITNISVNPITVDVVTEEYTPADN